MTPRQNALALGCCMWVAIIGAIFFSLKWLLVLAVLVAIFFILIGE